MQITFPEMVNDLSEVPDFEDTLMQQLDSDLMNIDADPNSNCIMQHMDIRDPLSKLKKVLEQRLGVQLPGYVFYLQDTKMLESHKNLVDQCVQGEGLVQINVQIQAHLKRINIVDVLKPAEDYISMIRMVCFCYFVIVMSFFLYLDGVVRDADGDDDDVAINEGKSETQQNVEEEGDDEEEEVEGKEKKNIVQWQVDPVFKKDQERLKIPVDPHDWNVVHVRHWVQWAVRQFNLPNIKLSDWSISGEDLFKLSLKDFQKICPNDPGDVFWTHLELLRQMKVVGKFFFLCCARLLPQCGAVNGSFPPNAFVDKCLQRHCKGATK